MDLRLGCPSRETSLWPQGGSYSYNRILESPDHDRAIVFPSTNTHVANVVGKFVHNFSRSLRLKVEIGPSFIYEEARAG